MQSRHPDLNQLICCLYPQKGQNIVTKHNRGGKSRDLLIQLSMQVSENVIVWTTLLDVIGADGSVL
jgi:hypothetical protein